MRLEFLDESWIDFDEWLLLLLLFSFLSLFKRKHQLRANLLLRLRVGRRHNFVLQTITTILQTYNEY